ncbi:hypothetical protein [Streptomyces zingiberis]|uniref:PH domain-containing protein n=1 Tax=Streptomyces zingiberis TaxID=2053010 RepID=A0ABX1BYN0_9ACTN|nr:hypothetical protein [Streptomyces zingiberis]NJQ02213.1 hypothetical protein [Streptomyces zingiberis]
MPLTFLTADRAFDESVDADDIDLRRHDENRWRRPYRVGPWRVGIAAVLLLLASYLLFAAVLVGLAGAVAGTVTAAVTAAAVIALALRSLRMGAWVSAHGLRHVSLLTTRTLPWHRLTLVRTVQQPVRWLGLPRTVQGQALVVSSDAGKQLGPLLTDHNADFLGRPGSFNRAADAVEGWAARHGAEHG